MNQATDFFERQSHARRKAELLLFYFVPAVVLLTLAVYYLVLSVAWFQDLRHLRHHHQPDSPYWNLKVFLWSAAGTLFVILCGSLYKMNQLRLGGRTVAGMLGASPVNPQTRDPDEKRLRDVVEEMAIASGVSVPEIFILRDEQSINAFVAGHSTSDAAIGVTEGALRLLTRDELQAVVAHEFSHILNGDMRLDLWLMGLLNGILCISLLGKMLFLPSRSEDEDSIFETHKSRGGSGGVIFFLIIVGGLLIVIGSLGYFFGRLIKAAVCRERENLADAAAVQFTRHPDALIGALKKIGGLVYGSRLLAADAEQASHLFFGNALPDPWLNFLSTHPPLVKRVQQLEPTFDGNFPHVKCWAARVRAGEVPGETPPPTPPPSLLEARQIQIAALLNQRSNAAPLTYAADLKASFSEEILQAAREPFSACALIYALLLSDEENSRAQQLKEISATVEENLRREMEKLFPASNQLSNGQKLALINLAMPALRRMSREQFDSFSETVQQLVESDRAISLFEYTLQKILRRELKANFKPARPPTAQFYSAVAVAAECSVLLSALARNGSENADEITASFQAGTAQLENCKFALLAYENCNLPQIDAALERLNLASLPVRKLLLRACACVVACDGVVQEQEGEMLRAIAEALDCPLPPFVKELAPTTEPPKN